MKRILVISGWLILAIVLGATVVLAGSSVLSLSSGRNATEAVATPPADWLTFVDPVAGYSFRYPPNARVGGGPDGSSGYTLAFLLLRHDNGGEIVEFFTLDNPERLSLEEFVQTEQAILYAEPTEAWRRGGWSYLTRPLDVAGGQALLVRQGEATWPLTGVCQQVVYVAHEDRVVAAKLCPGQPVWEAGYVAPSQTEDLYYQVLDTLEFLSNNPLQ